MQQFDRQGCGVFGLQEVLCGVQAVAAADQEFHGTFYSPAELFFGQAVSGFRRFRLCLGCDVLALRGEGVVVESFNGNEQFFFGGVPFQFGFLAVQRYLFQRICRYDYRIHDHQP